MKAIIMAGGEGSRLRPLTSDIPKPMAPILGKPVLEHIITLLKKHKITEIGMTLQYLPESIRTYFGDGSNWGVRITYFTENTPLGTAGSVKNAEQFLDDTFLVMSGDALTDIDITKALEFHKQKNAIATLILKEMEVPLEYGVVVTDKEGTIKQFLEKPSWEEVFSDTVNTGIYIIDPEALSYIPPDTKYDFSKNLFPTLLNSTRGLAGFITQDYWCDIGNIESYRTCQKDVLDNKIHLPINNTPLKDGIFIGADCNISVGAILNPPVFIGNRTTIKEGVIVEPYTVIGSNCTIGHNCRFRSSIVWDNCSIGDNSRLSDSILCSNVVAGEGFKAEDDIVIGSNCLLGEHVIVKSNVKIWPKKQIEDDTIVTANFVHGDRASQEYISGNLISGLLNTEITPEYISKIGSAFTSALGIDAKLVVHVPEINECQMVKHALLAGMISSGAKVYVISGVSDTNVVKYVIRSLAANGGIAVRTDGKQIYVELLNQYGNPIGKELSRSMHKTLDTEEFKRISPENSIEPVYISDAKEYYLKDLIVSTCRKRLGYRIGIYSTTKEMRDTLFKISSSLGMQFTLYMDKELLKECVKNEILDFGIMICENGSFHLVTNAGIVSDDLYFGLACLITLSAKKGAVFYVPQHISSLADTVAQCIGGTIERVKTSDLADKLISVNTTENKLQYELLFDYIKAIVRICEFLQINRTSLGAVLNLLPVFHKVSREADCPTSKKGYVMKKLVDEYDGVRNYDVTEGIKVYYENGWVLAVPDAAKQKFRILAEGFNEEYADEIADDLYQKLYGFTGRKEE